jgi:hypothetical protein
MRKFLSFQVHGERYNEIVAQADALSISTSKYIELIHESFRKGRRLMPYTAKLRRTTTSTRGYRQTKQVTFYSDSFRDAYSQAIAEYPDHEVMYIVAFDSQHGSICLSDGCIGVFSRDGKMNRLTPVRIRNVNRTTRPYKARRTE